MIIKGLYETLIHWESYQTINLKIFFNSLYFQIHNHLNFVNSKNVKSSTDLLRSNIYWENFIIDQYFFNPNGWISLIQMILVKLDRYILSNFINFHYFNLFNLIISRLIILAYMYQIMVSFPLNFEHLMFH